MATIFKFILTLLFVGFLLWVTLPNRDSVSFSLFPFFENMQISVAILVAAGIFVGFIWGGLIVWLNNADLRQGFRRLRRQVKHLEAAAHQPTTKNILPS